MKRDRIDRLRQKLKSTILIQALLLMLSLNACKGLPETHLGLFSGVIEGHRVQLHIQRGALVLSVNDKARQLQTLNFGADEVIGSLSHLKAGVDILPAVIIPPGSDLAGPWTSRLYMKSPGYADETPSSDRFMDVYAVFTAESGERRAPFEEGLHLPTPIEGSQFEMFASVLHFRYDSHNASSVNSIEVEFASTARLFGHDMLLPGDVRWEGLSISPQSENGATVWRGSLKR